jgi:3-oxoadipate enol-lactonase
MPFVDVDGGRLHYRFDGAADAPVLMLSNSLGTDLSMWDAQMPSLSRHFRVLRYDSRGHGQSTVIAGPYTLEQLAGDALSLLDSLNIERVRFCGLSMGGMVGMWLAVHAPERIDRLVLSNTAALIGPPELWNTRIETVRGGGMQAVTEAVIGRWFNQAFTARAPQAVEVIRRMLLDTPAEGYTACCAAIRDMDQRDTVARIEAPTLVIAGTHDVSTTPANARFLVERIAGARYVELDAAHLSNIGASEQFTDTVLKFLIDQEV